MKVLSYNLQHCNSYLEQKIDYELMARTIRELDADIVGLNEIYDKGNGEQLDSQTEILASLAGYSSRPRCG